MAPSPLYHENLCGALLEDAKVHAPVCGSCRQKVRDITAWVDPMNMSYRLYFSCCNGQMETGIDWSVAEVLRGRDLASLIPAVLNVPDGEPPWLKEKRDRIALYRKEDRKKDLDSLWETM